MTELDEEIGPIAYELIETYGKAITYTVTGESAYDTSTGKSVAPEESKPIKATVEDANGVWQSGSLIEKADKKILISRQAFTEAFGEDVEPSPSDKFEIDGGTYTVGSYGLKRIYSGELVAAYQIMGAA